MSGTAPYAVMPPSVKYGAMLLLVYTGARHVPPTFTWKLKDTASPSSDSYRKRRNPFAIREAVISNGAVRFTQFGVMLLPMFSCSWKSYTYPVLVPFTPVIRTSLNELPASWLYSCSAMYSGVASAASPEPVPEGVVYDAVSAPSPCTMFTLYPLLNAPETT